MGSLRTVGSGVALAGLVAAAVASGVLDIAGPGPGPGAGFGRSTPGTAPAIGQLASPAPRAPEPGPSTVPASVDGAPHGAQAVLRAQVLARIDYPWQQRLAGWEIDLVGPRPGFLGATLTKERRIEIYVDGTRSVDELAFTLAHELGHAVDVTVLDGADRDRWLAARGASGQPWWAANAESDYAVGAGDWAEAFAVWQLGGRGYSNLAGPPTEAHLALVARLAGGG